MSKEIKCPNCGTVGMLVYQDIQQCAYEHKVLKNGKISKRRKFIHIGSEEWHLVCCAKCNTYWTDTDTVNGFDLINGKIIFQEKDTDIRADRRRKL